MGNLIVFNKSLIFNYLMGLLMLIAISFVYNEN